MTSSVSRWAVLAAVAASLAGCGTAPVTKPAEGPVLVTAQQVAVVRADGSVAAVPRVAGAGVPLGQVPPDAGEVDGLAVSRDGRLVLVSALRDDDDAAEVCEASVLQLLPDGTTRLLAQGASLALSPTGERLAYFRYATVDGYCRRTSLVVRSLADGVETKVTELDDGPVGGTPPEWPVSWSPDGSRIAYVLDEGAAVTQIETGETTAVDESEADRPLAPGYLPDGRLLTMYGCCTFGGTMRSAGPDGVAFAVPGPVRSVRAGRDGVGAWLTIEEQGLHHWDGTRLRKVTTDALLTSG